MSQYIRQSLRHDLCRAHSYIVLTVGMYVMDCFTPPLHEDVMDRFYTIT